jgi:hypothetical protein
MVLNHKGGNVAFSLSTFLQTHECAETQTRVPTFEQSRKSTDVGPELRTATKAVM